MTVRVTGRDLRPRPVRHAVRARANSWRPVVMDRPALEGCRLGRRRSRERRKGESLQGGESSKRVYWDREADQCIFKRRKRDAFL